MTPSVQQRNPKQRSNLYRILGLDGTVSKWYDQSGNDNHATQGTPASQPKIVSGGSLITGGIDFDGVDDLKHYSHFNSAFSFTVLNNYC